ncbi:MAG TPA: host attachment family protein [Hyphomicrobiales bacterium]|nr:host attachment family protein [Hyphomicrobiales bacterium]
MKHGTWVVVADGRKVLFLHNQGDDDIMDLRVRDKHAQDNPANREQGADRPGRAHDSTSPGRSAMGQTDWHQIAEDRFAAEVAGEINQAALANEFKHLVVVAPPKALSELRTHLHKEAQQRLIAEIDKDLTNHTVEDMQKILADI